MIVLGNFIQEKVNLSLLSFNTLFKNGNGLLQANLVITIAEEGSQIEILG